jgi:hypothetical protein
MGKVIASELRGLAIPCLGELLEYVNGYQIVVM